MGDLSDFGAAPSADVCAKQRTQSIGHAASTAAFGATASFRTLIRRARFLAYTGPCRCPMLGRVVPHCRHGQCHTKTQEEVVRPRVASYPAAIGLHRL